VCVCVCTYPPTPGAKVLQRVRDDLHAVAEHAVQIELLVLVYHCRQEKDQTSARLEEVPREGDEVGCKCRQFIRLGRWYIRLVVPGRWISRLVGAVVLICGHTYARARLYGNRRVSRPPLFTAKTLCACSDTIYEGSATCLELLHS
jgi:hypothetical protein